MATFSVAGDIAEVRQGGHLHVGCFSQPPPRHAGSHDARQGDWRRQRLCVCALRRCGVSHGEAAAGKACRILLSSTTLTPVHRRLSSTWTA